MKERGLATQLLARFSDSLMLSHTLGRTSTSWYHTHTHALTRTHARVHTRVYRLAGRLSTTDVFRGLVAFEQKQNPAS